MRGDLHDLQCMAAFVQRTGVLICVVKKKQNQTGMTILPGGVLRSFVPGGWGVPLCKLTPAESLTTFSPPGVHNYVRNDAVLERPVHWPRIPPLPRTERSETFQAPRGGNTPCARPTCNVQTCARKWRALVNLAGRH